MRRTSLVVALMVLSAVPALAQQKPIELGADAALIFQLDAPTSTSLSIPLSQIRAGFSIAPSWTIEPMLGLSYLHVSGTSTSNVTVGVGALYHFSATASGLQPYVRPFIQTSHTSFSGGGGGTVSSSATSFGGGIGVKKPIVNRLMGRFEAALATSSNSTQLMLLGGLSFFTH